MKTLFAPILSLTLLSLTLLTAGVSAAEKEAVLQAGAATSNITPPLGLNVIGGFRPYPSKHIHDELHARCLVLDDGETRLAIVVCDLLGVHRVVSEEARRLIEEAIGLAPSNVLICATHTHSASSALGSNSILHDPPLDDYQKFVAQRIADGVHRASNLLQPAEVAFGRVDVPEHLFNRRWFMKPGTVPVNPFGGFDAVKMNPPSGSANLTEPAGPIDPTVSILSVRNLEGQPISLFASYSLHYVGAVGPAHVSADYFGVFCKELTRLMKADHQEPPFVPMLSNGTSGDINNINFVKRRGRRERYEQINYVANDVASKVYGAMKGLEYKRDITLAARYREPEIDYRKPTADEMAWAKETLAEEAPEGGRKDLPGIYAQRAMSLSQNPKTTPIPLQILVIGDTCIGTMPCEVFAEIGLEFKERSPFKNSVMVSLSHGYFGYLPSPRHFRLGGYETWLGTNRLEPQASVKMLDQLIEMAKE